MKLNNSELDLVAKIPKWRKSRRHATWIGLATSLVLLAAVFYFDYRTELLGSLIGGTIGLSAGQLAAEYFRDWPEEKIASLLLRYVNSDPEALKQLSARSGSVSSAA